MNSLEKHLEADLALTPADVAEIDCPAAIAALAGLLPKDGITRAEE